MRSNWINILASALLILPGTVFSQSVPEREIWNHFGTLPDTSAAFPGEDLVVLLNDHIIRSDTYENFPDYLAWQDVARYPYFPVTIEENYMQVYVRTDRGARLTWQLRFGTNQNRQLVMIKLRNLKPDGKVIDLPDSDIRFVLNTTSKTRGTESDYSSLPVPGVDAGDILEIYSAYSIPGGLHHGEVYFNSFYPTSISKLTYSTSRDYDVTFMKYNLEKAGCQVTKNSRYSYSYEFHDLPGLYNNQSVVSHLELPFLAFRVDSIYIKTPSYGAYIRLSPSSWKKSLNELMEMLVEDSPDFPTFAYPSGQNFFDHFADRFPGAGKLELATEWHNFINDSIALRFIAKNEERFTMDHWLDERATDRTGLMAWYIRFFNRFGISFNMYLTRELSDGYLDSNFVCPGNNVALFFGIPDGAREHYLFPKYESETYQVDEFPASLRGSTAIGLRVGQPLAPLSIFQIPFNERNDNWKNRNLSCKISDPFADRLVIDQRSYFNGEPAKISRSWNDYLVSNVDLFQLAGNQMSSEAGGIKLLAFEPDSSKTGIYKNALTYECDNFITALSDSTFSVRIKDVAPMDVYKTLPYTRNYGFYNLLPYYNTTRFYLVFDRPVELVNGDSMPDSYNNEFGMMHLKVAEVNDTMILVETHYSASALYLPPENYKAIEQLAARTLQMQEKRLFFRYRKN